MRPVNCAMKQRRASALLPDLDVRRAIGRHLNDDEEVERRLIAHWAPFVNSAVDAGWLNIDDPEATAVLQSENLTREALEAAFVAMGWDSATGRFSGNEFIEW